MKSVLLKILLIRLCLVFVPDWTLNLHFFSREAFFTSFFKPFKFWTWMDAGGGKVGELNRTPHPQPLSIFRRLVNKNAIKKHWTGIILLQFFTTLWTPYPLILEKISHNFPLDYQPVCICIGGFERDLNVRRPTEKLVIKQKS